MTTITVSAEMGGRDAEQAILPHLRTLKTALKGRSFEGFPLPEVAFILRVDGTDWRDHSYGLSGPGNIAFDRNRQWVSVDLGIPSEQWAGRAPAKVAAFVAGAIMACGFAERARQPPLGGNRLGRVAKCAAGVLCCVHDAVQLRQLTQRATTTSSPSAAVLFPPATM